MIDLFGALCIFLTFMNLALMQEEHFCAVDLIFFHDAGTSHQVSTSTRKIYFHINELFNYRKPSGSRVTTYMMLALWTAVMCDLPLAIAYSNANFATLLEACSVMSFILCTTPGTI